MVVVLRDSIKSTSKQTLHQILDRYTDYIRTYNM